MIRLKASTLKVKYHKAYSNKNLVHGSTIMYICKHMDFHLPLSAI